MHKSQFLGFTQVKVSKTGGKDCNEYMSSEAGPKKSRKCECQKSGRSASATKPSRKYEFWTKREREYEYFFTIPGQTAWLDWICMHVCVSSTKIDPTASLASWSNASSSVYVHYLDCAHSFRSRVWFFKTFLNLAVYICICPICIELFRKELSVHWWIYSKVTSPKETPCVCLSSGKQSDLISSQKAKLIPYFQDGLSWFRCYIS